MLLTHVTTVHDHQLMQITVIFSNKSCQRSRAGGLWWMQEPKWTKTTLLTSEEVRAIKESKPCVEDFKAIIQAGRGKLLSQQEFTLARNLLLVQFATDNPTRPGPLNNTKLKTTKRQRYLKEIESCSHLSTKGQRMGTLLLE